MEKLFSICFPYFSPSPIQGIEERWAHTGVPGIHGEAGGLDAHPAVDGHGAISQEKTVGFFVGCKVMSYGDVWGYFFNRPFHVTILNTVVGSRATNPSETSENMPRSMNETIEHAVCW